MSRTYRRPTRSELSDQTAHYAMCDRARALGITVSLDDRRAAQTTRGLRRQVRQAERAAA